jgi:hypothetical protein
VVNNIPEILRSRKTKEYILIIIIITLGVLSFGLGRLSANETKPYPVTLCRNIKQPEVIAQKDTSDTKTIIPEEQGTGQYVGSKNGTVYHLPWCSGAKRIQEENKIWFTNKAEAEAAGYRPAANCKGI